MAKRISYTPAYKAKVALKALKGHETMSDLVKEFNLHAAQITRWKTQATENLHLLFDDARKKKSSQEPDIEMLYAQIGKLQIQLDFLKKAELMGSRKKLLIDPDYINLSVRAQCTLLSLSRSSYYYKPIPETPENISLMKKITKIHLERPAYGYLKIHVILRRDYGEVVNEKRIERLWKILGFRSVLPRKNLSIPNLAHAKYPYLLEGMMINKPNQVFSIDITYIVMPNGFYYLVSVIDWFSRYVLSWEISNTLTVDFCIAALEAALKIAVSDYFNMDQGSQFTCSAFLDVLKKHPTIKISMDGVNRAIDNVYKEREWWSTKYEFLHLHRIETPKELFAKLKDHYNYYNCERPHEGLLYAVPYEIYHGITPKYCKGQYYGFEVKKAGR